LEWIIEQLAEFYSPQEARLWLFSRQKLLDGKIPADLISDNKSEEVLSVINKLREAVFI